MSEKLKLLAECYKSDLQRLDAIQEAAWYLSQLSSDDDFDFQATKESCEKERSRIQANLKDLEDFLDI